MKTTTLLLFATLGLIVPGMLLAKDNAPPASASRVEVIFDHPENFTDVRDSVFASEKGTQAILDQLKSYLERDAAARIPAGARLEVKFTDIDLAGDFEPARGPDYDRIRIIRDIYPPRMDLEFRLTDANGKVLREGKRKLRNLNFQMEGPFLPDRNDPLKYDKALLHRWVENEFTGK